MTLRDVERLLAALPEDVAAAAPTAQLLLACVGPDEERHAVPRGTVLTGLYLPVGRVRTSIAGPCAYAADGPVMGFLARLGWTYAPVFRSGGYMIPPGAEPCDEPAMLVPIPEDEVVLKEARARVKANDEWSGDLCGWPARFEPATFTREWSEGGMAIACGPSGCRSHQVEPGWVEHSTVARFDVGCRGVWHKHVLYDQEGEPEPDFWTGRLIR